MTDADDVAFYDKGCSTVASYCRDLLNSRADALAGSPEETPDDPRE